MRLVKGTLDNGQLLLDEPIDSTKPVRVMVTLLDETSELPVSRPGRLLDLPSVSLGGDPMATYSREEMYGDDMR
jgi:hypothetical protein